MDGDGENNVVAVGVQSQTGAHSVSKSDPFRHHHHSGCVHLYELPQLASQTTINWGHQRTEIHSLTALEDRSLRTRCKQGYTPSERPGGSFLSLPASAAILVAPWLVDPILQAVVPWPSPPVSASSPLLPLTRTPVIGLGPTLTQQNLILTQFHLQRPYLQISSHSQVQGMRLWMHLLGGYNSTTTPSVIDLMFSLHQLSAHITAEYWLGANFGADSLGSNSGSRTSL